MNDKGSKFRKCLNDWGKQRIPFVFIVDYAKSNPLVWKVSEVCPTEILYNFNGFKNEGANVPVAAPSAFSLRTYPPRFTEYQKKFDQVVHNIKIGNSFLVNLSLPTPVETDLSIKDIFSMSKAPYRIWVNNRFVCFSPEIFIKINGNRISSFPMKGTIDAQLPDAENKILNDPKEKAEHATIVDLIRNDLSIVCDKVWVAKYRYIDTIATHQKTLLQVSSEVAGLLPVAFDRNFGDILWNLLPAGSICGAPKPSTLEIIKAAEQYDRGYYTGVMGYFDGENFESAVMIRFIEQQGGNKVFKSGGGITALSVAESEYKELIDKVYLPFGPDVS